MTNSTGVNDPVATSYISASTTNPSGIVPRTRRAPSSNDTRADSSESWPAQSVWPIRTARTTPSSDSAACSERRTSSLTVAPALRITLASPTRRPSTASGSTLASMHVTIASRRAGSRRAGAGTGAATAVGSAGEPGAGGSTGSADRRVEPKGSQLPDTYSASCWYAIDWNDIR